MCMCVCAYDFCALQIIYLISNRKLTEIKLLNDNGISFFGISKSWPFTFANIYSPVFTPVMVKMIFFIFAYSFHYHLLHTKLESKTMNLFSRVLFYFQLFAPIFFCPRSAVNTFVPLHTDRTHILVSVDFS